MNSVLLALVAAAGFVVATRIVETTLGRSRHLHVLAMLVAAGMLLGLTFADLLPEAFELAGHRNAALAIAIGFLALYAVETLTSGHTHHLEPHAHTHTHAHARDEPDPGCVPQHAVGPFLLGIGVHNLADGVVIGASHEVSSASALSVAVGILVHQLPVGLSFAAVMVAGGVEHRRLLRRAVAVALLIPLGAVAVAALPSLSASALGILVGLAAGALLYIASGHLLPEAQSEETHVAATVTFAVALIATLLAVTALHG